MSGLPSIQENVFHIDWCLRRVFENLQVPPFCCLFLLNPLQVLLHTLLSTVEINYHSAMYVFVKIVWCWGETMLNFSNGLRSSATRDWKIRCPKPPKSVCLVWRKQAEYILYAVVHRYWELQRKMSRFDNRQWCMLTNNAQKSYVSKVLPSLITVMSLVPYFERVLLKRKQDYDFHEM